MGKTSGKIDNPFQKKLTQEQQTHLQKWLRPLQQACSIEAEGGFRNLLGRQERFHSFMARELIREPFLKENNKIFTRLIDLSSEFLEYPQLSDSFKQRLVIRTRQLLQSINKEFCSTGQNKKTTLRYEDTATNNTSLLLKSKTKYTLDSSVSQINGIGKKITDRLSVLGIFLIKDLLHHFPRDYVDYTSLQSIDNLVAGNPASLIAEVRKCYAFKSPRNPNLSILELHIHDGTGRLKVTRFLAGRRFSNSSYLQTQARKFPPGTIVAVSGIVKEGQYGKTFKDPYIEVMETKNMPLKSKVIGRLLPIYSLTEGISAEKFRDLVDCVLPLTSNWPDPLTAERLNSLSLPNISDAITAIHRPFSQESLQSARRRLVFDEFLFLQLGLLRRRSELKKNAAPPLKNFLQRGGLVGSFLELLPYSLTNAQSRVLAEIESDLTKTSPMSRLLQGDVGSGKTVVAIAALLNAVQSGWQGALMAPTEVLANQHYRNLCQWLLPLHINVELLTGSTPGKRRHQILTDLCNGATKILVGTHALIEDPVSFFRLGLVVVDEQHRFGVHQRNRLLAKGLQPHLLSMTATPIPRTLALSLYGDLDVSQIDELPPNRSPVLTSTISSSDRDKAYVLIKDKISQGQRAYFVLPLVEQSEKLDLRSAIQVHKQLKEDVFPDLQVGLLHGRMSSSDKQSIINEFISGKCQILVSTTVIEVGVDVPEASVMIIDHADRFGLSQLHQLRGRVGRGADNSYCLLINDSKSSLAKYRLDVLTNTNDGFEIAEIDLHLRGPGQVLGTKQSGLPDFVLASLIDDKEVLDQARKEAIHLLETDPELRSNQILKRILDEHYEQLYNKANLN